MRRAFIFIALMNLLGCHQSINHNDSAMVLSALYAQHDQWQGTPYRLGGYDREGIDCSGFVALTFDEILGIQLPRTTSQLSQLDGEIPIAMRQTGDLVFFQIPNQDKYYHVGIYLEAGFFLHAATSKGVMISSLNDNYWQDKYWKTVRVLTHN